MILILFFVAAIACENGWAQSAQWKLNLVGAGNIFYDFNAESVQVRRTYFDVTAEKKTSKGLTTGARIRFWTEPVFYNNSKMHQDGFGTDDTRTALDFLNEIEGYVQNIPLTEGKTNLLSVVAGKGYVRFGFDRPEEQAPFSEFPLIHPVTKAGGVGQVMHVRVGYKNTPLGLEVDSEIFEPATPDTEMFDVDLPESFGHGQAVSLRKNLPWGLVALGSFANLEYADKTTAHRLATGMKFNRNLNKETKLQAVVEYVVDNKKLQNGSERQTAAYLASAQVIRGKDTFAFQYGRVENPVRPAPVNQYTGYYGRKVFQKGRLKLNGFVEGGNTAGTSRGTSTGGDLKSKRAAVGIQFKF
ncbi:MAG: hypothetical protein AB7H48_02390 [Parachlamydiales bacterium]